MSTERVDRSWETISPPMTLAILGVLLVLLMFFPAIIGFYGPFGDCFDDACWAESRLLENLSRSQAQLGLVGFPVLVVGLLALAMRTWHAWLGLAVLTLLVAAAGSLPILTGFWEMEPQVFGVPVPVVSPGFAFWVPPAIVLFVASGIAILGVRRSPVEMT